MAIEAEAFDDLAVDTLIWLGMSPGNRLKRVDDIGAEAVRRKRKRCPNRLFCEPWMGFKNLLDRFSSCQLLQNQLDGNARACDHRFAHHHAGI